MIELVDPFVVELNRVGRDGLEVDEVVTTAWLAQTLGDDSPYRPASDGRLTAHIERIEGEDVFHVRGRAELPLCADCSRCVEPIVVPFAVTFDVALFPPEREPAPAADGSLDSEDMGVGTYTEAGIDLGVLVHDEVFLELPMNPLCREDCAGLCDQCGTNLNRETCHCQRPIDQRWSALREIKIS